MITASIGSHRFESGPSFHFNGSCVAELSDIIIDPTSTVEYVNALSGVNTTAEEMRVVAASGIARLGIENSKMSHLQTAGNTLVDVTGGGTIDKKQYVDSWSGRLDNRHDIFHGYDLSNQVLDSASVLATRKNNVEETADIIKETAPTDSGYFVIAIAHGGLISAARTFNQLGEGDHRFGMIRYSRYKRRDSVPSLMPYSHEREAWFKRQAKGRQVVVVDEDYSSGETLKTATRYFAGLLETKVMGIAPVEVDRRIEYKPLVIKPK